MIGTLFGSYRVVGHLGSGGMGTIYRAEHTLIGRPAAIKVLNPEYATNRDIVMRFFNEARAATQIQHPGIVEIFDFGYQPDGSAFIVMEFLQGESLASRLAARGTLSETEAFAIARGIATALAAAHVRGIVHRDIKPDNVFLVPEPEAATGERVKLLDFGIAKLTEEGAAGWSQTRTGAVLGTPSYMAPEQCRGAGYVDHRADLYALGCILFEMLAGRPPFVGQGAGEIIGAHQFVAPPRLRELAPQVSHGADDLCAALLAKDPSIRIGSAADVIRQLGSRGNVKATGSHQHLAVGTAGEIHATTTLGGAAMTVPPTMARPGRRRWLIAALAGGAVAVGAMVIALAGGASRSAAHDAGPGASPSVDAPAAPVVDGGVPMVDAAAAIMPPVDATPAIAPPVDAAPPIDAAPKGPRHRLPRPPQPTGPTLIEDI